MTHDPLCPDPDHPLPRDDLFAGYEQGQHDMLALLSGSEAHAAIVKVLNDEGADSDSGWHSWRCFDKVRYPEPCRCTEFVVDEVLAALRALQEMP